MVQRSAHSSQWEPYLCDWWSRSYSRRLIDFDEQTWFVKSVPHIKNAAYRERLAYLLGRRCCNVAEVRLLDDRLFAVVSEAVSELPSGADSRNTYLVRLGFDYPLTRLALKDINTASAAEVVFSLWIRRRDAHSFNRIYVGEVPVFFDHLTGLLGEPGLVDLDKFFACGPDAGYAGRWQFELLSSERSIELRALREKERQTFAYPNPAARTLLPIRNWYRTKRAMYETAKKLRRVSGEEIMNLAVESGYVLEEARRVASFLSSTGRELDVGIARLIERTERAESSVPQRSPPSWAMGLGGAFLRPPAVQRFLRLSRGLAL